MIIRFVINYDDTKPNYSKLSAHGSSMNFVLGIIVYSWYWIESN